MEQLANDIENIKERFQSLNDEEFIELATILKSMSPDYELQECTEEECLKEFPWWIFWGGKRMANGSAKKIVREPGIRER